MRTEIFSHSRHPFQVFILGLCMVSVFPTIVGVQPPPGTIAALVPHIVALAWSWIVFLGAGAGLFSAFLKDRGSGLIIEQLGLAFTGLACIFYAVVLFLYTSNRGGGVSAGITGGFGIACLIRCWQIQKYLHKATRVSKKAKRNRHMDHDDFHDLGQGI